MPTSATHNYGHLSQTNTWDGIQTLLARLALTSGQIAFPATQVASADANTLDDYEEGSWTPTLLGSGGQSGQVYSAQDGRYVKIGRFIDCQFNIVLSTLGTITGDVEIGGLPFATPNVVPGGAPQPLLFASLNTPWVQVYALPVQNTSIALVRGLTAAATANVTSLQQTDLTATSTFVGSLLYLTES